MKSAITDGAASLGKALMVFERIRRDRGRTALSALVADMVMPRSNLYRMVTALEQAGLISRLARGRYDVGLPLLETLQDISVAGQLARLCRPSLQKLAVAVQATAHLGVMENDMVTYLVKAVFDASHKAASFTRENAQLEAYCSGIGKVLLAGLPAVEQKRYLAGGPFVAITKRTITAPKQLQAHLEIVKAHGFACDDGEILDDLYCLAVPVRGASGQTLAAISVSFARHRGQKRHDARYLEMLFACADELGQKLGA